jgi:lambda repressor-like predicted transcriptional regulator
MVGVERWAEIRRAHFVEGVGIRALARRTGLDRKTIRRALRADAPPRYERGPVASKLDPHKEEIHRLLGAWPQIPATRIRELIAERGYAGGGRSSMCTCARSGHCSVFVNAIFGGVSAPATILLDSGRTDPTRAGARIYAGSWRTQIVPSDPRSNFQAGVYTLTARYIDCTPAPGRADTSCDWVSAPITITLGTPPAPVVVNTGTVPTTTGVSAACRSVRAQIAHWKKVKAQALRAIARPLSKASAASARRTLKKAKVRLSRLADRRLIVCP